jgi:hypothetical protein
VNPQGLQGVWITTDSVFSSQWESSNILVLQPGSIGYVKLKLSVPETAFPLDYSIPIQFFDENSGGEQEATVLVHVQLGTGDLPFFVLNKVLYPTLEFTQDSKLLNVLGILGWDGNTLYLNAGTSASLDFIPGYKGVPALIKILTFCLSFYLIYRLSNKYKKKSHDKYVFTIINVIVPFLLVITW